MASDRPTEVYKQFFEKYPDYGWSCEILLPQLVLRRIITIDELEFVQSLTTHSQRTVALFLGILPMKNKACQLKFILVLRDLQEGKLQTFLEEKFNDLFAEAEDLQNGQKLSEAQNLQYGQKNMQQNAQGGEVCPVQRHFGTTDPSQAGSVGAIPKASLNTKEISQLPPISVKLKASSKFNQQLEDLVVKNPTLGDPLDEFEFRTFLQEKFHLQNGQQDVSAKDQGQEACPVQRQFGMPDPTQGSSGCAIPKASLDSNEKSHLPPSRKVTAKASSKQSKRQVEVHIRDISLHSIKCVVVGDRDADKTSVLYSYTRGLEGLDEYIPTIFDNYTKIGMISGKPYSLCLYDAACQEDYDRLRPLSYPQTDVFLVIFSVISPSSFESVKEKWVPEISHHCPETPFLIVGTKIDLRNDSLVLEELARNNQKPVTAKQGEELARELRAVKYMECSAVTQEGLDNVFDEAILATLQPPQRDNKKICSIS